MARRTRSKRYWQERAASQRMQQAQRNGERVIGRILWAHDQALHTLSKDIDKLFGKFSEGMTKEEAELLLNTYVTNDDYEALQELYRTAQTKEVKAEIRRKLKAEPLKYRIARKEALQQAIERSRLRIVDQEISLIETHLKSTFKNEHLRSHFDAQKLEGIGFPVNTISEARLRQLTEKRWLGRSFSQSVWNNTDDLATRMNQVIPQGLMAGKSSTQIAKDLRDLTTDSSMATMASERLVRTETTWVVAEADKRVAKERGVKQMRFLATLDSRTSKQCQEHDNTLIDIDKLVPGVNQPPLHPYCRSVLLEDHEGFKHRTRMARDPETGKTYKVPGDMTYAEWRKKYVDDQGKGWAMKAEQNRRRDEEQFQRYSQRLTRNVPTNLKDFQKMKYSEPNTWSRLKKDHSEYRHWSTANFASQTSWQGHHSKHQREWGSLTEEEYKTKAQSLLSQQVSENILGYDTDAGRRVRYNTKTNEYAIGKNGKITTMFRPDEGVDYYDRNREKDGL